MIRTEDISPMVPRGASEAASGGLSGVLQRASRAADGDAAQSRAAEESLVRATRITLLDAFFRAKQLNGDSGFDVDDLAQLDAVEGEAFRLGARRRARPGDAP